ncbi:MAG: hypothetical protein LH645_13065 [Actinomycetia bacterium]|nr:hypothetical protein [Actinomycetes bacterium]
MSGQAALNVLLLIGMALTFLASSRLMYEVLQLRTDVRRLTSTNNGASAVERIRFEDSRLASRLVIVVDGSCETCVDVLQAVSGGDVTAQSVVLCPESQAGKWDKVLEGSGSTSVVAHDQLWAVLRPLHPPALVLTDNSGSAISLALPHDGPSAREALANWGLIRRNSDVTHTI